MDQKYSNDRCTTETDTNRANPEDDLRSGYVESMLKRFFELFGLITMAVGVYFVVLEHQKNTVCNQTAGKFVGFGVSAECQHVVYVYFGGFILLALGALVVIFGLLATRKSAKKQGSTRHQSLASQYQIMDPKSPGRTPPRP
jgi:hypothetical protein